MPTARQRGSRAGSRRHGRAPEGFPAPTCAAPHPPGLARAGRAAQADVDWLRLRQRRAAGRGRSRAAAGSGGGGATVVGHQPRSRSRGPASIQDEARRSRRHGWNDYQQQDRERLRAHRKNVLPRDVLGTATGPSSSGPPRPRAALVALVAAGPRERLLHRLDGEHAERARHAGAQLHVHRSRARTPRRRGRSATSRRGSRRRGGDAVVAAGLGAVARPRAAARRRPGTSKTSTPPHPPRSKHLGRAEATRRSARSS